DRRDELLLHGLSKAAGSCCKNRDPGGKNALDRSTRLHAASPCAPSDVRSQSAHRGRGVTRLSVFPFERRVATKRLTPGHFGPAPASRRGERLSAAIFRSRHCRL